MGIGKRPYYIIKMETVFPQKSTMEDYPFCEWNDDGPESEDEIDRPTAKFIDFEKYYQK